MFMAPFNTHFLIAEKIWPNLSGAGSPTMDNFTLSVTLVGRLARAVADAVGQPPVTYYTARRFS